MKISIVTATYNSGETLRDTLDSILAQTHQDFEVLVIDGRSTDDTRKIVDEYVPAFGDRLHWHCGKDHGLYDAMNKGIALATGDVIGILNSDDVYASRDCLSEIAKAIENVDAVYGDLDFVSHKDTSKTIRKWKGSQHTPGAFLRGWHPAHPTFYARRECYKKFGGFDTDFDVSADFELMLRFIEKGGTSTAYIPKTIVKMRMVGESTGSLKKIIQGNRNVIRAFEKNGYKTPPFYLLRRLAPKAINMIKTKLKI